MEALADDDVADAMYFGSTPVRLQRVAGTVTVFSADWCEDSASLPNVLARVPRQHGPDGVDDVVVPAIPALDVVSGVSAPAAPSPELLQQPVVKVPLVQNGLLGQNAPLVRNGPHACNAVASGVRSALVKLDGHWYRLKGCGNFDQGFTVRVNQRGALQKGARAWRDVRGAAFPHTAKRELYMTAYVSTRLRDVAVSCNESVALMMYDDAAQLPLGRAIQTACVVERTRGDRRLGTHVLAGLELLMPALIDESTLHVDGLLAVFPSPRPGRESVETLVPTGELLVDYMLATSLAGNDAGPKGIAWPDTPRDATTFANLAGHTPAYRLPERAPAAIPLQWTREGPRPMAGAWTPRWHAAVAQFGDALRGLPADGPSALAYLYARLGYDAGVILGGMHRIGVSWGTYQDGMCNRDLDEWHCNAHANNLVVLRDDSERLLAFLDLDMAFCRDTYVDIEAGRVGHVDWDRLLWREYVNLCECLTGVDSSNGVPTVARRETESQSATIRAAKTALYDTLMVNFLRGYRGESAPAFSASHHRAAHLLMQLAIVVMADFIA